MISQHASPEDHLLANERNLESLYTLLAHAPGVDYHESPECIRICTDIPHPLVNTVLRLRLASDAADNVIASTLQYFSKRKVPCSWMLNSSSRPTDIERRLEGRGMQIIAEMPGMSIDLADLPAPVSLPSCVQIRPVSHTDSVSISDWKVTTSAGSGIAVEVIEVLLPLLKIGGDRIHAFTAYLDGEPAGTSMLYMDGQSAGIYCVAVLPEARRRGIGAAVTAHALQAARNHGYKVGVLQASKMGLPAYERLGFRSYGRFMVHGARQRGV